MSALRAVPRATRTAVAALVLLLALGARVVDAPVDSPAAGPGKTASSPEQTDQEPADP